MRILFLVLLICQSLTSCTEDTKTTIKPDIIDPEPTEVFDEEEYQVTDILIDDKDNNGNPEDFLVTFIRPNAHKNISKFNIMISKSGSSLTLSDALKLSESHYTVANNDFRKISLSLSLSQLDTESNEIAEDNSYSIYILTIGSYNDSTVYVLSDPSPSITLTDQPVVKTLAKNINANDGVSIDEKGNIYVSNYGGYNQSSLSGTGQDVKKITPSGEVSVFTSGLTGPLGSSFDIQGNFYVVSGSNFTSGDIIKVTPDGIKSTIATIPVYPAGIATNEKQEIFISNYWSNTISKIDAEGELSIFADSTLLFGGVGIGFDSLQNIIVGNYITGNILKIDRQGSVTLIATIPTIADAEGTVVGYITVFDGYIYATGLSAHIIYRVSLDGKIEEWAGSGTPGSSDGSLKNASFNQPNGIGIDKKNGILYISGGNGHLRYIKL